MKISCYEKLLDGITAAQTGKQPEIVEEPVVAQVDVKDFGLPTRFVHAVESIGNRIVGIAVVAKTLTRPPV